MRGLFSDLLIMWTASAQHHSPGGGHFLRAVLSRGFEPFLQGSTARRARLVGRELLFCDPAFRHQRFSLILRFAVVVPPDASVATTVTVAVTRFPLRSARRTARMVLPVSFRR